MSAVTDLRDGVRDYLLSNGVGNVTSAYRTKIDVKTLSDPQVTVVPSTKVTTPLSRGSLERNDVSIDIAYRARVSDVIDEIDRQDAIVEGIEQLFPLGESIAGGTVVSRARNPLFSVEHLEEFGVFTSVVRVTFAVI